MRAMDGYLLFKTRRLCFDVRSIFLGLKCSSIISFCFSNKKKCNNLVIDRFKSDSKYRLDTITNQFFQCIRIH